MSWFNDVSNMSLNYKECLINRVKNKHEQLLLLYLLNLLNVSRTLKIIWDQDQIEIFLAEKKEVK